MSNNEPDYDNLAFDPSALNPCNDGKRGSDVLMTTLVKCQAIVSKNVELEKKLKIAEKALMEVYMYRYDVNDTDQEDWFKIATYMADVACKAKEKIKE